MKCIEIMEVLRRLAPEQIACSWDNVGLLCGRKEKEVKKLLLCLDVTDEVVEYAAGHQVDMVISHHPLLFRAVKRITDDSMIGNRLIGLIQADISYYAMHTNFDSAEYGMAYAAAERIGLQEQQVLDEPAAYVNAEGQETMAGIGRIGVLAEAMTVAELAGLVKRSFAIDCLPVYGGSPEQSVRKIAILPGSGKDQIDAALQQGADVLITGDINHHGGLDAKEQGLIVMDAGHYNVEQIFSEYMEQYLKDRLGADVEIEIAAQACPYSLYY